MYPRHIRSRITAALRDSRLVGIEVKASATLRPDDFAGLHALGGLLKKRLVCGMVLDAGDAVLPFGDRPWAVPIQSLWAP